MCETCNKPAELCLCDEIESLATKTTILILQHPKEPDQKLGSAILAHLALENSILKTGLSWKNLKHASGLENPNPKQWGVLFVGTKNAKVQTLSTLKTSANIKGLIVLDGSWAQAKTMWWRNPWLLKLHRCVLSPSKPSLYGKFRREPRKECLSTLEAVSLSLKELGEEPASTDQLDRVFETFIDRIRAS